MVINSFNIYHNHHICILTLITNDIVEPEVSRGPDLYGQIDGKPILDPDKPPKQSPIFKAMHTLPSVPTLKKHPLS